MKSEKRTDIRMLHLGETLGVGRSGFQTGCAWERSGATTVEVTMKEGLGYYCPKILAAPPIRPSLIPKPQLPGLIEESQ